MESLLYRLSVLGDQNQRATQKNASEELDTMPHLVDELSVHNPDGVSPVPVKRPKPTYNTKQPCSYAREELDTTPHLVDELPVHTPDGVAPVPIECPGS